MTEFLYLQIFLRSHLLATYGGHHEASRVTERWLLPGKHTVHGFYGYMCSAAAAV